MTISAGMVITSKKKLIFHPSTGAVSSPAILGMSQAVRNGGNSGPEQSHNCLAAKSSRKETFVELCINNSTTKMHKHSTNA